MTVWSFFKCSYNIQSQIAVFYKEAARLYRMIRSARYTTTGVNNIKYTHPFFVYVRRRGEVRMEIENVIVNGVGISQPAELCEVFRSNFSSTFRNDEGYDPQLNCSAKSRMAHVVTTRP